MDAKTITGFCDLNVTFEPDNKLLERIIECKFLILQFNSCSLAPTSGTYGNTLNPFIFFFPLVEYQVIALNWTVDVSKLNTKTWPKKRKGEKEDSNLVVFPPQLAKSFSNIASVVFLRMYFILCLHYPFTATVIFRKTSKI